MKPFFLFLMISITHLSCFEKKQKDSIVSENEKIVRQFFVHFNNHDWIKMASLYADTTAFKDPEMGIGIVKQTRAEIIEKYTAMSQMIPEVKDEIVQIYPSSDKHIIVEFVSKGVLSDGNKLELPICTIFTIENGLITKDYSYYDNFEEPKK
jgi:ketosteroid isomerase-like protein